MPNLWTNCNCRRRKQEEEEWAMEETLAAEEVSMKKRGAKEHWQLLARNHQGAHHPVPQRAAPAASNNMAVGALMSQVDPDMVIRRGPPTRKAPEAWQSHQDSDKRGSQQSRNESPQQMQMVGKDGHVTSFSGPVPGNVNTVQRESSRHSFSDVVIALGGGCRLKDEDKRNPASRAYNRAFNKILGQKNPSSPGQSPSPTVSFVLKIIKKKKSVLVSHSFLMEVLC